MISLSLYARMCAFTSADAADTADGVAAESLAAAVSLEAVAEAVAVVAF